MKKWRYCILILVMFILLVLPAASVENGKIAFSRAENNGNFKIYVINPDGTGLTILTNNQYDNTNPAWSPDGTKITFSQYDNIGGSWTYHIYVMNADGNGQTRLTNNPINDYQPRTTWSPDGSKIAFSNRNIYIMNADGTGQTPITSDGGDMHPAWSPDGTRIAFARDEFVEGSWTWRIYVMNADGTGQTRLTNNEVEDTNPAWSPDGTKIAFQSGYRYPGPNGGQYIEVHVMNADGTGQTRLTHDYNWDGQPSWSPDGTKIAYTRSVSGTNNAEIYVMNPDGTGQIPLTSPPGLNEWHLNIWPSWGRVPPPPTAAFAGTPRSGTAPLAVQFTDKSTGSPAGWAWYFGDETYTAPWTQITASAEWSSRYFHRSVVMPDGSIILMGGDTTTGFKNDVWRSKNNGATWIQMNGNAEWSARGFFSSVAMPDGNLVLTGGQNSYQISGFKDDVWLSNDNGATWTQMTASAEWLARSSHSSVVMPDGNIVLMGGSLSTGGYSNDVWRSPDSGATWTQMTASAGWTPRAGHSSVVMPDGSIVLIGGQTDSGQKNDVWRSIDNGKTWIQVTANAGWSARSFSSTVVMPDGSIVLMGGTIGDSVTYFNDVWRSTDNGATWTQLTPNAGWSLRDGQSGIMVPDGSIVLMGGWNGSNYVNDVWRFMPAGSSAQNPSHTYTKLGIYSVALQVFNSGGFDDIRKVGYITVNAPTTNVPINVKIVPKTINLGSKGYFLAFVTLPDAYKGATIDMKTVSCSGAPAVRMMKLKFFPRMVGFVFKTSALNNVQVGKRVTLTMQGELKNKGTTYTFTGSDTIKVISKPSWQPDDIKDVSKESDEQLFKKYSI